MTTFENKCAILADLWINYRYEQEYTDIIAYNDLGFPLAYAVDTGIVESNERISAFINEAFDMLLGTIGVEDNDWQNLDEMIG